MGKIRRFSEKEIAVLQSHRGVMLTSSVMEELREKLLEAEPSGEVRSKSSVFSWFNREKKRVVDTANDVELGARLLTAVRKVFPIVDGGLKEEVVRLREENARLKVLLRDTKDIREAVERFSNRHKGGGK